MAYNEDSEQFEYTHEFSGAGSEAVDDVYYDSETNELLVVVTSGYGYLYRGVPYSVFDQFRNADSFGRFYNFMVKGKYTSIGIGYDPEVDEKSYEAPSMAAVGTPKALTYADGASITFAPEGFGISNGQFVTTGSLVSLSAPVASYPADRVTYKHVVHFTVEGGNEVKTYTVEAGSNVHEGVEALKEVAEALGQNDFVVKGVYISFE